jgi:hypothetical protein
MADVYLDMHYKLDVSDRDMRLICLGLAGKLKRPDDIRDAAELNVRLCKAQQIAEEAHAAMKRVEPEKTDDVQ